MAATATLIDEQQQVLQRLSRDCAQMRETREIETRSVTARARTVTDMVQKNEKMEVEVSRISEQLQQMRQTDVRIETNAKGLWAHISSHQAAIGQIQREQAVLMWNQSVEKMREIMRGMQRMQDDIAEWKIGKDKPSAV